MSAPDASELEEEVAEEALGQEAAADGYTTGGETGTDEECSDFFGEDMGPMAMLDVLNAPQPDDNTLEPFQIARKRRRDRRAARVREYRMVLRCYLCLPYEGRS